MKLEIKNIRKSFGNKQVLLGLSFCVESGKAFGLLGRNGAGKTTLIRILMNVFAADSGEILIDGRPISSSNVQFGYLPEERGLYPKKKVGEQLIYYAELKGMSRSAAKEAIAFWLDRLGMSEHYNKRLDTLSKGNQQKIQLITALAHNPDIVILDEPFSGLDPVNAMLLKDIVRETIAKGKIVLFSSHQMYYIEEFCDNIAIINRGEIVLSGELHDIKRNYPRNTLLVSSPENDKIAVHFPNAVSCGEYKSLIIKLNDSDNKKETMKYLTDNYDIDKVEIYEPSLNDIFVEYTEHQA